MPTTSKMPFRFFRHALYFLLCTVLIACGSLDQKPSLYATKGTPRSPSAEKKGSDVVIYALGLLDTGYRFGGKNPEAGLDCSGMVSYIYQQAVGIKVIGSAADIAKKGKVIQKTAINPGDLVFFNTLNRPFSHVGIFIGDQRFIHAPNSKGSVRIDRLDDGYYAKRYEAARSLLEGL